MKHDTREGVSLIIVLGLLSVLTILAIAFSRSMRESRLSSRSYADQVRAENLAQVALIRAMEDVDASLQGYCYPYWNPAVDAMASTGSAACTLLKGETTNFIPRALWEDAALADQSCRWRNIVSSDGRYAYGRIAYLVINCSGLLDANVVGGVNREYSLSTEELDLSILPDVPNPSLFLSDRTNHLRYETIEELAKLNTGVSDPVSNLFIYSLDPDPHEYFLDTNSLGFHDILLTNKFAVNTIPVPGSSTNYLCYIADMTFMTNYWEPLTNVLADAGFPDARELAWNLVNYLDADRIPQTDELCPWLAGVGCEAVPLINEVVLRQVASGPTNVYEFAVEVWFPFAPVEIQPSDGFELQVAVSPVDLGSGACTSPIDIVTAASGNWSFRAGINRMVYGDSTEFLTFVSPSTNRISFPSGTTNLPISAINPVWLLARVVKNESGMAIPVDQAMTSSGCFEFTDAASYSVNDPRDNGRSDCWTETSTDTLGATNENCNPWCPGGQGTPIRHADGLLRNAGEIGFIHTSQPWKDIDLMTYAGGQLLDRMTANTTHPFKGRVSLSTQQKDVLRALLAGSRIGHTNSVTPVGELLTSDEVNDLADAIHGPYLTFADCFEDIGLNPSFTGWRPDGTHTMGDMKEDAFRNIVEMVTWRQNMFTIVVAAQAFVPDGQTPVAEKRAVAVIVRDAYTGQHFVRFQKWLTR